LAILDFLFGFNG